MKYLKNFRQINELHKDTYLSFISKSIDNGNIHKAIGMVKRLDIKEPALESYLETALFVDDPVERFDEVDIDYLYDDDPSITEEKIKEISNLSFTIEDFTEGSKLYPTLELLKFRSDAGNLLDNIDDETIGRCFYLSRNGHGSGFFDEPDLSEEQQDSLQELAEKFGESGMISMIDNYTKLEFM